MKFDDLVFEERPYEDGIQAKYEFSNGCRVSVVAGDFAYCEPRKNLKTQREYKNFEIAVLEGTEFVTRRYFKKNIGDDVVGFMSREEITALLEAIENGTKI
jgi:hypothetical protein